MASGRPSSLRQISATWLSSLVGRRPRRLRRRSAVEEQLHRVLLGERAQRVLVLASQAEGDAARDDDVRARAAAEEVGDDRPRLHHLLEVVEHEEDAIRRQPVLDGVEQRACALGAHSERLGDLRDDLVGSRGLVERDEEDAVWIGGRRELGGRHAEPALADAAGPGERDEPDLVAVEARHDVRDLGFTADEARQLGRQPHRADSACARGQQLLLYARRLQLEQRLGAIEALEREHAELGQRPVAVRGRIEQLGRHGGDESLAAVRRRADPRRTMHLEARVVVRDALRASRVEPDPGAHRDAFGPCALRQRAMHVDRRVGGAGRRRERTERAVALVVNDHASVSRDAAGHDNAVRVQHLRDMRVAKLLDDGRRAVDVHEEERDHALGELGALRQHGKTLRDERGEVLDQQLGELPWSGERPQDGRSTRRACSPRAVPGPRRGPAQAPSRRRAAAGRRSGDSRPQGRTCSRRARPSRSSPSRCRRRPRCRTGTARRARTAPE